MINFMLFVYRIFLISMCANLPQMPSTIHVITPCSQTISIINFILSVYRISQRRRSYEESPPYQVFPYEESPPLPSRAGGEDSSYDPVVKL